MRAMVANIVSEKLKSLTLEYPKVGSEELAKMAEAKNILENEQS